MFLSELNDIPLFGQMPGYGLHTVGGYILWVSMTLLSVGVHDFTFSMTLMFMGVHDFHVMGVHDFQCP
jgi:hypothetical protein